MHFKMYTAVIVTWDVVADCTDEQRRRETIRYFELLRKVGILVVLWCHQTGDENKVTGEQSVYSAIFPCSQVATLAELLDLLKLGGDPRKAFIIGAGHIRGIRKQARDCGVYLVSVPSVVDGLDRSEHMPLVCMEQVSQIRE